MLRDGVLLQHHHRIDAGPRACFEDGIDDARARRVQAEEATVVSNQCLSLSSFFQRTETEHRPSFGLIVGDRDIAVLPYRRVRRQKRR